jgi:hypothetical protein
MLELHPDQRRVTRPVVHDERRSIQFRATLQPLFDTRDVGFTGQPSAQPAPVPAPAGEATPESGVAPPRTDPGLRTAADQSELTWSQGMSQQEAERRVRRDADVGPTNAANGRVADLCEYLAWLRRHYAMTIEAHDGCPP